MVRWKDFLVNSFLVPSLLPGRKIIERKLKKALGEEREISRRLQLVIAE